MRVSILYMTIDRYPDCIHKLSDNINRCGLSSNEIEILWCDNGSKQKEVITEMGKNALVTYHRVNKENEGIARTLNQLIIRSKGDYIVQLGNDYKMPDNWLEKMVNYAAKVPKTGMVAIPWSKGHCGELATIEGTLVHLAPYDKPIFGVKLKTREMLNEVGAFDEKLHPYGLEDSDYHRRSVIAGFNNYYIPDTISSHGGGDSGQQTEYRLMKDYSIKANGPYFVTKNYKRVGYYIHWPAMNQGF